MSQNGGEVANISHWDGAYNAPSDIRFEEDSTDINDDEAKRILKLKPRKYVMKNDPSKKLQYGFISQEVQEHIPEIIQKSESRGQSDNDDQRSAQQSCDVQALLLNQIALILHLVKVIQDQERRIQELESKISFLMNQNDLKSTTQESN